MRGRPARPGHVSACFPDGGPTWSTALWRPVSIKMKTQERRPLTPALALSTCSSLSALTFFSLQLSAGLHLPVHPFLGSFSLTPTGYLAWPALPTLGKPLSPSGSPWTSHPFRLISLGKPICFPWLLVLVDEHPGDGQSCCAD